jgi:four helix bundle protein
MAHRIDEFPVFLDAQRFCSAVSEILKRSRLRKDSNVYKQIDDANESILANMDEGFAQESDDAFAKYLYYSKGSVEEVMRRLERAALRDLVQRNAVVDLEDLSEAICKQLGGLIKYLKRSGFKDRGRFRSDAGSRIPD